MAARFWVADDKCHLLLGVLNDPQARILEFTFQEWDSILRIVDRQIKDINAQGGHEDIKSSGLILPGGER